MISVAAFFRKLRCQRSGVSAERRHLFRRGFGLRRSADRRYAESRQRPIRFVEAAGELGGVGVAEKEIAVGVRETPADVRPVQQIRRGQNPKPVLVMDAS